jgi:hypothetical protein
MKKTSHQKLGANKAKSSTKVRGNLPTARLITIDCSKISDPDAFYIFEVCEHMYSVDEFRFTTAQTCHRIEPAIETQVHETASTPCEGCCQYS